MKAQQKQIGKKAFELETVQVTRRVSIHEYEHRDLMTTVDAVLEYCAEGNSKVLDVAGEMADTISNLVELSNNLAQLQGTVSGICDQFTEDGGDMYDASYLLGEHADVLQDLNTELRQTTRSLIGHLEQLIHIRS